MMGAMSRLKVTDWPSFESCGTAREADLATTVPTAQAAMETNSSRADLPFTKLIPDPKYSSPRPALRCALLTPLPMPLESHPPIHALSARRAPALSRCTSHQCGRRTQGAGRDRTPRPQG